ncbi:hypothetical protein PNU79_13715 [Turicibacter sanguinis]|uniref:hypothetical protein n=1 Tax=Turicibacter sanguinis TaxID=154288 RepID=UPI00232BC739|nr:hypothetical protein [Turicibacter sanguinis]MDB8543061.1 hypothetical protein [Turicibacter sanguinis]
MVDPTTLTKDELISNLWLTDEIMSEIEIIKDEIEKKRVSLESTIQSTEQEYLKTVKENYTKSELCQAHQTYDDLIDRMKHLKGIVILIDLIICILLGYLFIMQDVKLMYVMLFWITVPILVYLIYDQIIKYYLKAKKPKPLSTLDEVIAEVKTSTEYLHISDSLIAKHIKQEMKQLELKIQQLEVLLDKKTVLPDIYRVRAKDVVWYLENQRADNLKEALAALVDSDHREQVKQMIEQQNHEIEKLNEVTEKLIKDNQKLKQQVEQQYQQIIELSTRKK